MCVKISKENKVIKAILGLIAIGMMIFGAMIVIYRILGRPTPAGGGAIIFTLGVALLSWLFKK